MGIPSLLFIASLVLLMIAATVVVGLSLGAWALGDTVASALCVDPGPAQRVGAAAVALVAIVFAFWAVDAGARVVYDAIVPPPVSCGWCPD